MAHEAHTAAIVLRKFIGMVPPSHGRLREDGAGADVRLVILESADQKTIREARSIRLLNPTAAVDLVRR